MAAKFLESRGDHGLPGLPYDGASESGWTLLLAICLFTICALVSICGESMIIYYIAKFAPKERPINTMILHNKVYQ